MLQMGLLILGPEDSCLQLNPTFGGTFGPFPSKALKTRAPLFVLCAMRFEACDFGLQAANLLDIGLPKIAERGLSRKSTKLGKAVPCQVASRT